MGAGWHRGGGRGSPTSAAGQARCCRRWPPPSGRTGWSRPSTPIPEAVAAASALVAAADLGNVAVREGRADETGLAAGSLEVVMVRHVLAHNGGAEDAIVAHLAALLRPGGCLYLVDADRTAIRVIPQAEHPDLVDLQDRYLAFRAANGDDNAAGLRLAERLVRAGLELVEFRGRYVIRELSSRLRSPAWAAREAMVAAAMATTEDLRRWDQAFEATAARPPTFFVPMFTAIGRRPAIRTLRGSGGLGVCERRRAPGKARLITTAVAPSVASSATHGVSTAGRSPRIRSRAADRLVREHGPRLAVRRLSAWTTGQGRGGWRCALMAPIG